MLAGYRVRDIKHECAEDIASIVALSAGIFKNPRTSWGQNEYDMKAALDVYHRTGGWVASGIFSPNNKMVGFGVGAVIRNQQDLKPFMRDYIGNIVAVPVAGYKPGSDFQSKADAVIDRLPNKSNVLIFGEIGRKPGERISRSPFVNVRNIMTASLLNQAGALGSEVMIGCMRAKAPLHKSIASYSTTLGEIPISIQIDDNPILDIPIPSIAVFQINFANNLIIQAQKFVLRSQLYLNNNI